MYERARAAQQLAALVRMLGPETLRGALQAALPALLAAAADASPAVQRQALWALHHLAIRAPNSHSLRVEGVKGLSCSMLACNTACSALTWDSYILDCGGAALADRKTTSMCGPPQQCSLAAQARRQRSCAGSAHCRWRLEGTRACM